MTADRDTGICGDPAPAVVIGPPIFCTLRAGHIGWHETPQWAPQGYPVEPARWSSRRGER